jgi:pyridoxal phosphate enzyme (YggS family)
MMTLTVADRLAQVRHRLAEAALRAGRSPEAVTLVGVCKMADRPAIDEAYAAGLRHFGENRVQEAQAKFGAGRPVDLVLHLIGHLQTNKARDAVRLFQIVESADSTRLLDELDRQAARAGRVMPVLLEVNIAGEASKQGASADEAEALAAHAFTRPYLQPRGLMTVAPLVDDAEAARPVFVALRGLRDRLCERHPDWSLPELSMGMTNDFEVAIEEGATIIRVGRAIFTG